MKAPNRSQAVMAQRHSAKDGLDDFPTPPWATRGFIELALGRETLANASVWEPAANRGHMVRVLEQYAADVRGSDIFDYGFGYPVFDFLSVGDSLLPAHGYPWIDKRPDWIFTNPPFKDLNQWIQLARKIARIGVVIFARVGAIETIERYEDIYAGNDLHWTWSQHIDRVPVTHGMLDPKESQAGAMGWLTYFVYPQDPLRLLRMRHVPPCRLRYELKTDYR